MSSPNVCPLCVFQSLNGLQMENTVSSVDGGHLSDPLQRAGLGSHAKLERQGSKGSKGCPTPSRLIHSPLGNRLDTDKQSNDLHGLLSIVGVRIQKHFRFRYQLLSQVNSISCSTSTGLWDPILGGRDKVEGRDRGEQPHALQ